MKDEKIFIQSDNGLIQFANTEKALKFREKFEAESVSLNDEMIIAAFLEALRSATAKRNAAWRMVRRQITKDIGLPIKTEYSYCSATETFQPLDGEDTLKQ